MPADIFRDDVCALAMLAALLCYAGSFVVHGQPLLRQRGAYLGLFTVVGLVGWRVFELQSLEPTDLLPVVVSGLLAGCAVAGAAWIALPVVAFVWSLTGGPLARAWRTARSNARTRREERRRQRAQRKADQQRLQAERALAPQRERERREAEARALIAAQQSQQTAQQQAALRLARQNIRLRLEVFYQKHEPEIKDRYPDRQLRAFLNEHLGDDQPLEVVEQRAAQLEDLLEHHLEKVVPSPRHKSLAELAGWLEAQQRQVATIADPRLQEFARGMLLHHYTERTKEVLRESVS